MGVEIQLTTKTTMRAQQMRADVNAHLSSLSVAAIAMKISPQWTVAIIWASSYLCTIEAIVWPLTKPNRRKEADNYSAQCSMTVMMTANRIPAIPRGGESSSTILEPQSNEALDKLLLDHENELVVIDFYSTDCVPCQRIAPLFHEMSRQSEFDSVTFVKINVDHHPQMAAMWNVTGWPTILFIQKGQVQTEIVGGKLVEATLYDWIKLFMPKKGTRDSGATNDTE